MASVPTKVVEFVLLGRNRPDEILRYTQDGGVGTDIWLTFAADPAATVRALIAPAQGVVGISLASLVHDGIRRYRASKTAAPIANERPGVSPMDSYVAVTIGWGELTHVLLPMTDWWSRNRITALQQSGIELKQRLRDAIKARFSGTAGAETAFRLSMRDDVATGRNVTEAAPVIALIGLIEGVRTKKLANIPEVPDQIADWLAAKANAIADAAYKVLSTQLQTAVVNLEERTGTRVTFKQFLSVGGDAPLIQRVFVDRKAAVADAASLSTIKSDAATRVFDVSCQAVTWAIIDSGIAKHHPAFLDHGAKDPTGKPIIPTPCRVQATYDFTRLDKIRSFDLTLSPAGTPERVEDIAGVIAQLLDTPGRKDTPEFRDIAQRNLTSIALQLDAGVAPDWGLIEPLIRIDESDDSELLSDHGTHVAGVLGADWRGPAGADDKILQGVCPDIKLYDLRVLHESSEQSTESAVISALEFVRFVNGQSTLQERVIAGVNVSLSIPHDPKKYGCGATPVCVACDLLSDTGVIVVAAAGNRGWTDQGEGLSSFAFCSITDPGNARNVITVGSTHAVRPHQYGVSYFSSRGPTGDGRSKPDVVAPGEKIRGPVRGETDAERDGTSFAAPHVSGAAAMLISRHKELHGDPARVKEILCRTATDLGREKYFQGHGLIDVLRALQSL